MTPTIDSSPPPEAPPPASNLHLLDIDSSARNNNHQQISATPSSSSSSSASISSSSASSSSGSQSDNNDSSKASQVLLTLENKLIPELEDEDEYDYEALPENTSLAANLLAGATAGIMVSCLIWVFLYRNHCFLFFWCCIDNQLF